MRCVNGEIIMRSNTLRTAILALFLGLIAGCGQITPVAYTPTDQIQPGPGLLSGEDGEFTLYRR